MTTLQVYDPPMCCSTGICGPSVDSALIRFAADVDWLKTHGIQVERHNLSQDPMAFVANEEVKSALSAEGNACLPLLLADGKRVLKGSYPESREQLVALLGLEPAAAERLLATKDEPAAPPTSPENAKLVAELPMTECC